MLRMGPEGSQGGAHEGSTTVKVLKSIALAWLAVVVLVNHTAH